MPRYQVNNSVQRLHLLMSLFCLCFQLSPLLIGCIFVDVILYCVFLYWYPVHDVHAYSVSVCFPIWLMRWAIFYLLNLHRYRYCNSRAATDWLYSSLTAATSGRSTTHCSNCVTSSTGLQNWCTASCVLQPCQYLLNECFREVDW